MIFNKHYELRDKHAFLGASKYHWINYDENKLINTYNKQQAVKKGIILHSLAAQCIELGQKLPKSKKTLNLYVNDAIGYRMIPEQPLYYSENCFGTTDAISFRKNFLRIHDLKTGETPAHMEQLEIYAALFCLEYEVNPSKIDIELRIYQNDEVVVLKPETDTIETIMNKIIVFDKAINKIKYEENA